MHIHINPKLMEIFLKKKHLKKGNKIDFNEKLNFLSIINSLTR